MTDTYAARSTSVLLDMDLEPHDQPSRIIADLPYCYSKSTTLRSRNLVPSAEWRSAPPWAGSGVTGPDRLCRSIPAAVCCMCAEHYTGMAHVSSEFTVWPPVPHDSWWAIIHKQCTSLTGGSLSLVQTILADLSMSGDACWHLLSTRAAWRVFGRAKG